MSSTLLAMAAPATVVSFTGEWRAELLEAAAPPGGEERCVCAHLCWPFYAGEVAERTGGLYVVDCFLGGVLAFFFCFQGLFWAPTRARLRRVHNIKGSLIEDCVVTTLLPCCFITQALNHLDIVDAEALGAAVQRERRGPLVAAAHVGVAVPPPALAAAGRGK